MGDTLTNSNVIFIVVGIFFLLLVAIIIRLETITVHLQNVDQAIAETVVLSDLDIFNRAVNDSKVNDSKDRSKAAQTTQL